MPLITPTEFSRSTGWKRSHGWVYTGTNGETRDTDKTTTSRTTAPALDPTTAPGRVENGVNLLTVQQAIRDRIA
jgi:hypothetical protein